MGIVDYNVRVTPIGTGYYCYLTMPDKGFGAERYSVRLRLDPQDKAVRQFIQELAKEINEWLPSGKKRPRLPFKNGVDEETGTDYIEIHFYQDRYITGRDGSRKEMTIDVLDSTLNPIPSNILIGSGSQMRVGFVPLVYDHPTSGRGCRLVLRAVQIISLKEVPSQQRTKSIFTAVSGGFTAKCTLQEPAANDATVDTSDDDIIFNEIEPDTDEVSFDELVADSNVDF